MSSEIQIPTPDVMSTPERVLFTWSGGKDSALALYHLEMADGYEILALLTTVTEDYGRISMHGVRTVLLEQQADSLRLPLEQVRISRNTSNEEYEARMEEKLRQYQGQGVQSVVFGDIFLEDLKKYREENLAKIGMEGVFPIWKQDTGDLARSFIELGFKAVITCVDTEALDRRFSGREFDERLLAELPVGVDPCGENGEFHSFVYDGPLFRERIPFRKGRTVLRDNRFCFCDLIPVNAVGRKPQ
jgi:uncharacterized protein (TIGR00290 family)